MAKKKFVLRIDESTMKSVEKWAADEFRSINGQLEWIITQGLKQARRHKSDDKDTHAETNPAGTHKNQTQIRKHQ
ncbi:MAG: hypothetical protein HKN87_21950 [Saprospiraceae bacterium]|nr:hypothetical protein [Saprospiraceae bacterium]